MYLYQQQQNTLDLIVDLCGEVSITFSGKLSHNPCTLKATSAKPHAFVVRLKKFLSNIMLWIWLWVEKNVGKLPFSLQLYIYYKIMGHF